MTTTTVSQLIPAGRYWVGDPGYAYEDHDLWIRLLESADYEQADRLLEARVGDERFVASVTAFGDGTYSDREGRDYPVDAGLVGVVPARPGQATPWGMHEVEFEEAFDVSYEDGTICIGPIAIETDPRYECDSLHCRVEVEQYEDYCADCQAELDE